MLGIAFRFYCLKKMVSFGGLQQEGEEMRQEGSVIFVCLFVFNMITGTSLTGR